MDQLDYALDLMRRMPPSDIEDNLEGLIDLVPDLMEALLSAVDQPLKIATDSSGRDYLLCDYNRDGDSYRSPWTNSYDPPLDGGYEGTAPSPSLRTLEQKFNEVFDVYRDLYFEGGVSSVYTWDLDGNDFACVILIKKLTDTSKGKGTWDSIHVVEISDRGATAHYKLTSTVMLSLTTTTPATGDVTLSGSMTRQSESDGSTDKKKHSAPHIVNIGKMVEEMESRMRMQLDTIYFGKTKDIICGSLRTSMGLSAINLRRNLASDAMREMQQRMAGN